VRWGQPQGTFIKIKFMKRSYKLIACILVLSVSCTKSSTENPNDNNYRIIVKEYATRVLLPAVQIKLYTCSNYDVVFGCQSASLYTTLMTDQKGECTITNQQLNKANQGMLFSKSQYWDRQGGSGENFLEPEAWVRINLKTINNYPDTSFFVLTSTSQLYTKSILTFKATRDTVVNFRLFGNQTNKLNWMVYTKDSRCFQYCPIDSITGGNLTLNPQKFENMTTSINY
jgi:hypothetical protein